MAASSTGNTSFNAELNGPWMAYRLWACTARYEKRAIDGLTSWSLRLAIGGSVAAALAEQLKSVQIAEPWGPYIPITANVLRVGATAAIALAAFFSRQAQGGNRVDVWRRSRAAAESLKSGIYFIARKQFRLTGWSGRCRCPSGPRK